VASPVFIGAKTFLAPQACAQQSGARLKKLIALLAGREEQEAERFGASPEKPKRKCRRS